VRKTKRKRILTWLIMALAVMVGAGVVSCVRFSGGTWMINEASLPAGWPDATPVGKVQVKEYPAYRAATVRDVQVEGSGQGPMFRELFQHIKDNDIPMTAPVEIGYDSDSASQMVSMAFLYRSPDQGKTGEDGVVEVGDFGAQTMASLGMRGGYTTTRIEKYIVKLQAWLTDHADEWESMGPPRLLGYNSPFVPGFMRYGELQIPVRKREPK
jgi:hypothetical protein